MAAAGALGALAATDARAGGTRPDRGRALTGPTEILSAAKRWHDATLAEIVRAWEPRFRFRQFRPWEEGDAEEREAPAFELETALDELPIIADDGTALLMLAVNPRAPKAMEDNGSTPRGILISVLAESVLERAERAGYFATDPGALRFPDLPVLGYRDRRGDEEMAEEDVRDARGRLRFIESGITPPAEYGTLAEEQAALAAAEARLAGMKAGTIPCLTEEEKRARHSEQCEAIVAAYRARLESAGIDASWAELPGKAVQS